MEIRPQWIYGLTLTHSPFSLYLSHSLTVTLSPSLSNPLSLTLPLSRSLTRSLAPSHCTTTATSRACAHPIMDIRSHSHFDQWTILTRREHLLSSHTHSLSLYLSFDRSLTLPLSQSLTHSLAQSLTHSLAHSLTFTDS